ncbi:MAG: M14 family metallopeptidase, partial [Gemmatimonadales bacterium]
MSPRLAAAAAAPILLAPVSAAAQQPPLTIGGITARAGERASGFLDVPPAADSGTRIPITIVRGASAGPTLALIGGTHGSEVAPVVALQRVRSLVDPRQLRGTLLIVHVANLPSFLGRTIYYSPIDRKNLNRVYPGNPSGTVSERIAHRITTEIIDRADYLVDMHAGDGNESLRPYTYWNKLGLDPSVDSVAREMAVVWGAEHIIVDTTRTRDRARSIYTQNTAHIRGKPALTTENGYLGLAEPAMIERNVQGALRLLRHFGMLPGEKERSEAPVWFGSYEVLTSPETGVWHPKVERGHSVSRGAIVGVLTDFFGDRIAEIKAPFDGEVMYVVGTPAMNKGEPVGMIAVRAASPR